MYHGHLPSFEEKVANLNNELRYSGFKELANLCACEINSIDSICEMYPLFD
jgi:hypothetical protein